MLKRKNKKNYIKPQVLKNKKIDNNDLINNMNKEALKESIIFMTDLLKEF